MDSLIVDDTCVRMGPDNITLSIIAVDGKQYFFVLTPFKAHRLKKQLKVAGKYYDHKMRKP